MSQMPDKTAVSMGTIQAKIGDLAALYKAYKGINPDSVPNTIADQMFSPNDLQMVQYVDAHPELQQQLQQFQAQQDALNQMNAETPRMDANGVIYTDAARQQYAEQQANQDFLKGLDNVTSGILGAFGEVLGQYWFPDDPARANAVGSFGANVGDFLQAGADMSGGLKHETSEYIPNETKQDLYSPKEPPYSNSLSTDPKRYTPPWGHDVPPGSYPYNYNKREDTGLTSEVVQPDGGNQSIAPTASPPAPVDCFDLFQACSKACNDKVTEESLKIDNTNWANRLAELRAALNAVSAYQEAALAECTAKYNECRAKKAAEDAAAMCVPGNESNSNPPMSMPESL